MSFCLARLDVDGVLDGTMYPLEFQCKRNGFWLLWYRQRHMTPRHPRASSVHAGPPQLVIARTPFQTERKTRITGPVPSSPTYTADRSSRTRSSVEAPPNKIKQNTTYVEKMGSHQRGQDWKSPAPPPTGFRKD